MNNYEVNRFKKALRLKRNVIGVRFLYFPSDFEKCKAPQSPYKVSYCKLTKIAIDGNHFKANESNIACRCAVEAIGLDRKMEGVNSGQRYYSLNLYESRSVAKIVTDTIENIDQSIVGIEMGPLEEMEAADLVIFMCTPCQLMRVVQGYSYKWGIPKNISMAGNQGMCADLTAAPFVHNDMNFSVLCAGTRKMCGWGEDEMGVGLPIQQFVPLTEGILATMNYIEYPDHKQEIRDSLEDPDELGVSIDDDLHYGKLGGDYVDPKRYNNLKKGCHD